VTCSLSDHDFSDALKIYSQFLVECFSKLQKETNNFICESILKMIDDLNSRVVEKRNLVTHSKKVGSATYNLY